MLSILHQSDLYTSTINSLLTTYDANINALYQQNLKLMKGRPPEFYKITEALQLNEISVNHMRQKNAFIKEKKYGVPYLKAIQYFKQIQTVRSPIHKLKVIVSTSRLIDQCIREFYESNQHILQKIQHYDADQILSIFLYIIGVCQYADLYRDVLLIEKTIHKDTLNSASGYMLTTVKGCIYHIGTMSKQNELSPYDRFSLSFKKAQSSHSSQVSQESDGTEKIILKFSSNYDQIVENSNKSP